MSLQGGGLFQRCLKADLEGGPESLRVCPWQLLPQRRLVTQPGLVLDALSLHLGAPCDRPTLSSCHWSAPTEAEVVEPPDLGREPPKPLAERTLSVKLVAQVFHCSHKNLSTHSLSTLLL